MAALRWRWTVGGRLLEAELDLEARKEIVRENGVVRSEAERGAKPEGHAVADVVVAFDAYLPRCTLRRDGETIPPDQAPRSKRSAAPRTSLMWPLVSLAMVAVAAYGIFRVRHGDASGLVAHRAETGTFVARAPARLRPVKAVAPPGAALLHLGDDEAGDAVVIFAEPAEGDAWTLHKRRAPEVLAALPRGDGSFSETSRREDRCAGETAAIVVGRTQSSRGVPAQVFTCAFRHDDVGYVVAWLEPDGAPTTQTAEVQRLVDTLDLTRLEPTGAN